MDKTTNQKIKKYIEDLSTVNTTINTTILSN